MTRFVPAFLLVSAIYVDECIDMGLLGAELWTAAQESHEPCGTFRKLGYLIMGFL